MKTILFNHCYNFVKHKKMKLSLKYIALILFFLLISFSDSILRRISKDKIKIEKVEQFLVKLSQNVLGHVIVSVK